MSADREQLEAARARMQAEVARKKAATKRRLSSQKAAARQQMEERRAAARAALDARRPDGRERRRWPWLLFALLLLLLLIPDCRCSTPPPAAPAPAPAPAAPAAAHEEPPPPPPPRIQKAGRPTWSPPTPAPMTWVDSFHLQVSARAPRLSACFVGAADPGTLRWTTSVAPATGRVGDHELEPMLASADLTREQRRCVLEALEDPPYKLDPEGAPSTPVRVGLVLEF